METTDFEVEATKDTKYLAYCAGIIKEAEGRYKQAVLPLVASCVFFCLSVPVAVLTLFFSSGEWGLAGVVRGVLISLPIVAVVLLIVYRDRKVFYEMHSHEEILASKALDYESWCAAEMAARNQEQYVREQRRELEMREAKRARERHAVCRAIERVV